MRVLFIQLLYHKCKGRPTDRPAVGADQTRPSRRPGVTYLVHEGGLADVGVARDEEGAGVGVERGQARQVLADLLLWVIGGCFYWVGALVGLSLWGCVSTRLEVRGVLVIYIIYIYIICILINRFCYLVEVGEGGLQALHHGAHPPQRRALEGLAAVQRVACVCRGDWWWGWVEINGPFFTNQLQHTHTQERKKEPLVTSRHASRRVAGVAWLGWYAPYLSRRT